MIALHVWGSASLKTYVVLIVLAAGYVVAFALGMVPTSEIRLSAESLRPLPAARAPAGRHLRST